MGHYGSRDAYGAATDREAGSGRAAGPDLEKPLLLPPGHPRRKEAESFVAAVYDDAFGASLTTFAPLLVAALDEAGRLICVAGLRTAGDGFFSEAYLDAPFEQVLRHRTGTDTRRDGIFEVTTLASRCPQVSPRFLSQIAWLGKASGFDWAVFTATERLRMLLLRLGLPIFELAPADPDRLGDARAWGRYYEHDPRVCAVDGSWAEPALPPGASARA